MNEIFERTSVREFLDKQVSEEDVKELLKAAMQAPSSNNTQPWEFYVVNQREILDELSEVAPHGTALKNAPLGIVLCSNKEKANENYLLIDMGICAENIMLEAVSLGLGTTIIGVAPYKERIEKVSEILDLPENLETMAMIAVGYPEKEQVVEDRYDSEKVHFN